MSITVGRSPLRALALALLAVPMLLLAVDMTWSHRWFPEPDSTEQVVSQSTDASGSTIEERQTVLTRDGEKQRNRDIAWSIVLGFCGIGAATVSLRDLLLSRRLLTAGPDGFEARLFGARKPPIRFTWNEIAEIRSGILDDEGGSVDVLSIRFVDPGLLPARPAAAVVEPPWLHLLADGWDTPPHLIVPQLEGWVTGFRHAGASE